MASNVPPQKNTAYTFYWGLVSRGDTTVFQASPTLAAGDVKVAIDDAAPANIATLPVVDADFTKRIKVDLSAAEMNGDKISVLFSDVAGAEWCDVFIDMSTVVSPWDTFLVAIKAITDNLKVKKNTALAAFPFLMVDSTGTPKTGLTITATRSLDGAAFAACANSATELSNGIYLISLAAGDLNATTVMLRFAGSGARDTFVGLVPQP